MDRMKDGFPKLLSMFALSQFTYYLLSITEISHINSHTFTLQTSSGEGDFKHIPFQFPSICFNVFAFIAQAQLHRKLFLNCPNHLQHCIK